MPEDCWGEPTQEGSLDQGLELASGRGSALCLSGGGYRAMLFHVGGIRLLNEVQALSGLDRVSGVSGGSIAAAVLGLHWNGGEVDMDSVERDVLSLSRYSLDWRSVVGGPLTFRSPAARLAVLLDRVLFDGRTLQDLPEHPRFVFNTTNLATGNLMRWSRPYAADYQVGWVQHPTNRLSEIVAASAAFPPFLSPMRVDLTGPVLDFQTSQVLETSMRTVSLTDGGVYDNLALQTATGFNVVFVSDGGAPFHVDAHHRRGWVPQLRRTVSIMSDQLRRRRRFELHQTAGSRVSRYCYWAIDDSSSDGKGAAAAVAALPTRLRRLPLELACAVIDHGHLCAHRAYGVSELAAGDDEDGA